MVAGKGRIQAEEERWEERVAAALGRVNEEEERWEERVEPGKVRVQAEEEWSDVSKEWRQERGM